METFTPEQLTTIKTLLNLTEEPWLGLDDDLLALAFIHQDYRLAREIETRLLDKYQASDYEFYEFIGDAVLEMLVTNILTELMELGELGQVHQIRQDIVKNISLYCSVSRRGLCQYLKLGKKTKYHHKLCADLFEAILGVLYWYLYYIKGLGFHAFDYLRRWLIETWDFQNILEQALQEGHYRCGVEETGYDFSSWSSCQAKTRQKQRTGLCVDNHLCTLGSQITQKQACDRKATNKLPNLPKTRR